MVPDGFVPVGIISSPVGSWPRAERHRKTTLNTGSHHGVPGDMSTVNSPVGAFPEIWRGQQVAEAPKGSKGPDGESSHP